MENEKTRYDVLLAQLDYIKNQATKRFNLKNDGNDELINQTTGDLANVCMRVDNLFTKCPNGYHREDGMCVPD